MKLINHHGNEGLCTITQIKVLGTTMLENFRDEFLTKDDSHEVFEGTPTYFKSQPSKSPEFSIPFDQLNMSPNDLWSRLDLNVNTKYSGPSTIIRTDDSDTEMDDQVHDSIKYDHKNYCYQSDFFFCNWRPRHPSHEKKIPNQVHTFDIKYHKGLNETHVTSRKFKFVALKMISHLFEVPFSKIIRKEIDIDIDIQSTSLAEVNGNQLIPRHQLYSMEDSIAAKIFSQQKNVDPHDSIFRTLSKRIKVLEQSALILEDILNNHKRKSTAETLALLQKIQEAEDAKTQLRLKVIYFYQAILL